MTGRIRVSSCERTSACVDSEFVASHGRCDDRGPADGVPRRFGSRVARVRRLGARHRGCRFSQLHRLLGVCLALHVLVGCVDEDPDTTGDEDVTDVSSAVDVGPRADADPGATPDADATPSVDTTTDAVPDADHDASTDATAESGETCTMGEYLRYNGCPCDTNPPAVGPRARDR